MTVTAIVFCEGYVGTYFVAGIFHALNIGLDGDSELIFSKLN